MGDLNAVERAQDEAVQSSLANGPPEELARVKTQRRADFIRGMERIRGAVIS